MKELFEYRVKMLARLREAAQEFRLACETAHDPYKKMEGEWTLHQTASHVRDVNKLIYGARIHRTLAEDNPEFISFDADDWMNNNYNEHESPADILTEFTANVEELCDTLSKQPREVWSRESRHETIGEGLSLQLWVERGLAHIEEHLLTLKKAENK
jgi:Ni,Fe-hydrogenase I large subunit